jgi:putative ABC transport system substrate-binding protein
MRRIGVLLPWAASDPQAQIRNAAFLQGLQQLGWSVGQNVQMDYRWSGGNMDDRRRHAAELAALAPDVIFTAGSAAVGPLQQVTRTVPIVFVTTPDPVGAGFVDSLARPGGNITGFTPWEYGIGAKWLELLKEIMPSVTRVAVLRDPAITAGIGQWAAIQSVSPSFGGRVAPDRCAERRRDGARAWGLRRKPEWRSNTDRERVGDHSPRFDHRASGTAPAARGLLRTILHHCGRFDLVWG